MKKYRLYLDNCCFNRPFDDQKNLIVYFETQSKLLVQEMIKNDNFELVWSFILTAEKEANFDVLRRDKIAEWMKTAIVYIKFENDIEQKAFIFFNEANIKPKDAFHIASAIKAKCDFFLTTDKKLINKSSYFKEITIINPIEFIKKFVEDVYNEE